MRIARRAGVGAIAASLSLALAAAARAAGRHQLVPGEGATFSILGHSCGGTQEQFYATGFGATGFPEGEPPLQPPASVEIG